jgi:GNAT superfamily N-acetyltransferase
LAKSETDSIGFIIGSIQEDNSFILDKAGIVEDWFVDESYRGEGIGLKLYQELEKWFILKKCKQVCSETWQGNELSINSHFKNGFFISGVTFGKKL